MPKIEKQNNTTRLTTQVKITGKESVLSRIAPVEMRGGLKVSVYGRGKTGKTRLACTFPKPLLLIGTEDGTKSVLGVEGVDFVKITSGSELTELTDYLRDGSGGKYKSAVLDHGGGLQDITLKEVLKLDDIPLQSSWGMAQRGDWQTVAQQWKERVRPLLDLADTRDMNIVIIAHERNFKEDDDNKASDVMFPSIGPALTPSITAWLNGACDYICNTFIREQEVEEKRQSKIGNQVKETVIRKKTNVKEYCLRVGPHPIVMTGFRLKPGIVLPDMIVDANYAKILALIQGKEE